MQETFIQEGFTALFYVPVSCIKITGIPWICNIFTFSGSII